ncbi:bifunctional 4-hydroxy-2-oxoglutarate aldolase/2-dehydro-3-deoxy-phosphogluconate aldolase [Adhaeretor mobilis]|uniref:2-dehydro-3-deoxy-phosphogluconate aldolase n=1 Tax=Adhaeretor mobilis TaxID=1930276 RepID=A0A517MZH5_9BACT|nr:bifunctional 4-hydroxy-2-oxoglutarate aldolase/2-dehydro-3-deoxy-phosphogluconate aldolase [Adhaeretor mobilis]QDT00296.1 KHG/KDPG aldolase [Adhaeretor mobilis]
MNNHVFQQVKQAGVLAVLMIDRVEHAVPLANALLAGGVRAMELTLRSDAALPALEAIRAATPEMIVGVGTVLTPEQVQAAQERGAAFLVSPGLNPRVLEAAAKIDVPFAPGIATASDIEAALEFGCKTLKYFPAELLGGLPYLRAIAAPYAHLGLEYIPLGGVKQSNLAEYLAEPLISAVGGSWLAPNQLLHEGDWGQVEDLARAAAETVKQR